MEKNKYKDFTILFLGFIIIYSTILFSQASINITSLAFLITALIFLIFKIDSRFLIFAALLHLWFAPFMLLINEKIIAENTAVYAYYFLVIGVLTQFIEFKFNYKNSIDFEKTFKKFLNLNFIVPIIIIIVIETFNYFKEITDPITKIAYYYILSLLILFLIIKKASLLEK